MDLSLDESDCDEMPELNSDCCSVQPYMFEPTIVQAESESRLSQSESDEAESDESLPEGNEIDSEGEVDDVTLWCTCNHCTNMATNRESKCCQETNIVDGKIAEAEIECITLHEGFIANCLNTDVLETSYYEYIQDNGPLEEGQLIHKVYRHISYRRFVRWIYHWLGKKNRRVLPSCVVKSIRDKFPSQQYCGFKYPE